MKIGELAAQSGLAQSRIRFYEASGLIQAQRQPNGYREYPPQTLRLLGIIAAAQSVGFTLDEIRSLLPAPGQPGWKHDELLAKLHAKVAELSALQKRLRDNKAQLLAIIEQIENKPADMQCADNAERLLARFPAVAETAPRSRAKTAATGTRRAAR